VATLQRIAAAHGVEAATIAIAWLLAKPDVVPLAGAKTGEQAARNAQALAVTLNETEVAALDGASEPWRLA
jgi:aryl-alcohol dehydrogenase-like predicted oxidoreductase